MSWNWRHLKTPKARTHHSSVGLAYASSARFSILSTAQVWAVFLGCRSAQGDDNDPPQTELPRQDPRNRQQTSARWPFVIIPYPTRL